MNGCMYKSYIDKKPKLKPKFNMHLMVVIITGKSFLDEPASSVCEHVRP